MERVLITPRSFGLTDPGLFDRIRGAGFEPTRNPTSGILNKDQMRTLIGPCVGVILGVDPFDADVLSAAPRLRAVSRYGVGMDNVDAAACAARGVRVSRTVGANSEAVADYTMALMLAVARRVLPIDAKCRQADWSKVTTQDLSGKTLGLIGLGAIGRLVARRARGFEMSVLAYDPYWDAAYAEANGVEYAPLERIYRRADVISLHVPLTEETRGIVGAREIGLMKPTAVLINTARGGLIDEEALLTALTKRGIYGAGLDAFTHEPPADRRWFELDNVVMGSHCAASTVGAAERMGTMATENLLRDLAETSGAGAPPPS